MCCPQGTWASATPSAKPTHWRSCPRPPTSSPWPCDGALIAQSLAGTSGVAWKAMRICNTGDLVAGACRAAKQTGDKIAGATSDIKLFLSTVCCKFQQEDYNDN